VRFKQVKENVPQYPIMDGYKMQCCDCGLIHEIDFQVVKVVKTHKDGTWACVDLSKKKYRIEIKARRVEK
jgi:hypothetical protein